MNNKRLTTFVNLYYAVTDQAKEYYITKSREECRERRSRVRADCGCVRAEGWLKFFSDHDKNDVLNLNMVHWLDSHDIKTPLFSTHLEANPY